MDDFGGQWLEFRALESVKPDTQRFGKFDDYLKMSDAERNGNVLPEYHRPQDRSVLDFLNGKYTFLNERLAEFYGIRESRAGIPQGRSDRHSARRRLDAGQRPDCSSYSTRTSVVLRGKWVLENLLNAPVPPPPPNVPALDDAGVGTSMSLRQRWRNIERTWFAPPAIRAWIPSASGWRISTQSDNGAPEDGKFPIDASGTLPDGTYTSNGPAGVDRHSGQQQEISRAP